MNTRSGLSWSSAWLVGPAMNPPSRRLSALLCVRPERLGGCWSVGESVSEVNLEGCAGGCPGAGGAPLAFGSCDGEVDQLGGGLFVGEVPAGLDRLADLAVQRFDRVGRVNDAAQLGG